jgi:hypothetical protein
VAGRAYPEAPEVSPAPAYTGRSVTILGFALWSSNNGATGPGTNPRAVQCVLESTENTP